MRTVLSVPFPAPGCLTHTVVHKQPRESPGLCGLQLLPGWWNFPTSPVSSCGEQFFLCPTRLRSNLWDVLEPYADPWRGHSSTGTPASGQVGQRVDREQVLAGQRQASSSVSAGSSPPRPSALNFAGEWCCGGSSPAGGEIHHVVPSSLPGPSPQVPWLPGCTHTCGAAPGGPSTSPSSPSSWTPPAAVSP